MIDNVLIVIVHVYSINNGGGPWHEPKNGAENPRLHRFHQGILVFSECFPGFGWSLSSFETKNKARNGKTAWY